MQKSFFHLKYAAMKQLTRRDRFLAEIDSVTPWSKRHKLVKPFYHKMSGNVFDVPQAHALLHGDETLALGAAGNHRIPKSLMFYFLLF